MVGTGAPKIGIWAWSFVGFVVATVIVVTAFAAVSEILLPLLFAAVLAVIFKPVSGSLERGGLKPSLAAGLLVLGLLALMTIVLVATVRGVVDQKDEIGASVDAAINYAVQELGIDQTTLDDARRSAQEAAPTVAEGALPAIVSGLGSLVAFAGALILAALIMYYLLKDGTRLRQAVVAEVDDGSIRDEVDRLHHGRDARSSATTGEDARRCRRSSPSWSASPLSSSASRWCSRSWW